MIFSMSQLAWKAHARTGPVRRFKKLVFFAVEGLIALHDERTPEEDYHVILPADFEKRAIETARYAQACMSADSTRSLREEGRQCMSGATQMREAVKEARDMGDPSDPAVQAFWRRHQLGKKSTVSLRAGRDAGGYPDLPELPQGKASGRTAEIDGQVVAVDDKRFRIHRPPRRKQSLILDV